VNVETFLIYTYILSLIFRRRWQQKCDRIVIIWCWRRIHSKTKLRYYMLYKLRVLLLREQNNK